MEPKARTSAISGRVRANTSTNGAKNARREEQEKQAMISNKLDQAASENLTPAPTSILKLAHEAVNGERMENYGSQHENFTRIADIWTVILKDKIIKPITPQEVAMCQVGLKLARLTKTGGLHRDSIVDIAGYAECLDSINIF